MRKIGVLDSGIGGLTTVYYILRQNPHINIIYYADNKNAPYGVKTNDEVFDAVNEGVLYLISQGVELIVLACNTATATSIKRLRKMYDIPFVGTEPETKNKCENCLLLCTPLTMKTRGFTYKTFDTSLLADIIEKAPNNRTFVTFANRINGLSDSVILGCTHYVFLRPYLKNPYVFDGGLGVAKRVDYLLNKSLSNKKGRVFLHFSGRPEFLKYKSSLIQFQNLMDISS